MAAVPVPPDQAIPCPCANLPVLLIDDDDQFRTALSELLQDDGHEVHAYRSVAELPALGEQSAFGVVIADHQLGEHQDGLTFGRQFNAAHPSARIILVTAYASHHLEQAVAAIPCVSLLHKPVQYERLHRLLHRHT